jgi:hypothetical protein
MDNELTRSRTLSALLPPLTDGESHLWRRHLVPQPREGVHYDKPTLADWLSRDNGGGWHYLPTVSDIRTKSIGVRRRVSPSQGGGMAGVQYGFPASPVAYRYESKDGMSDLRAARLFNYRRVGVL